MYFEDMCIASVYLSRAIFRRDVPSEIRIRAKRRGRAMRRKGATTRGKYSYAWAKWAREKGD